MRILVVDVYYPDFLRQHYAARPGLGKRSYEDQLASLLGRCFGTADAFTRNLGRLGHESANLIVNCEPLQRRWAREHGLRTAPLAAVARFAPRRYRDHAKQRLLRRIAEAQIEDFGPDILYLHNLRFFGPERLDALRARGIGIVGQIASPAPSDDVLRRFDLILSSFPHYVRRFRELGVRSEYLPIAFDEAILDRLRERGADPDPASEREHDVVFIGGIHPRVHPGRVAILETLRRRFPLETWGYGEHALTPDSPLREGHHGPIFGLEMYELLTRSRIVVNTHIEAAEGAANNMRLFEATAMGALVVTEGADNLPDLFEPGAEVETYVDVGELVEKLRYYLDHEDERRAIAAAGRRRTLAEHTYGRRIEQLAAILERERPGLPGAGAGGGLNLAAER